ncbi:MAG: H/ACA RNA-protein complex protein Gar1 [Candidatus Bathyarchaeota archaeon]|nr:MAG: H/ACA RNA-protein complex protein Gar1 [Candidatus Bathyarchaeota archaeon]
MQRIGRVLHISPNSNIILKAENLPRIRDEVVDEKHTPIGTVFDIFGSISSPYISVRSEMKAPETLINRVLYAIPSRKSKRVKRRRRR